MGLPPGERAHLADGGTGLGLEQGDQASLLADLSAGGGRHQRCALPLLGRCRALEHGARSSGPLRRARDLLGAVRADVGLLREADLVAITISW
jgi:hypothetical protein